MNIEQFREEDDEPIKRKLIKLEDLEKTQQMWTQINMKPIDNSKIEQNQVLFFSQRERFNYLNNTSTPDVDYPLPQIFKIDFNVWKKNFVILSNVDVLRVRQLLNLDKFLFRVKVLQNSLQLQFFESVQENIPPHHQNPISLPPMLQQRQNIIKGLLNTIVQQRHAQYLIQNDIVNFNHHLLKSYHQDFPLEGQEDIQPIHIDAIHPIVSDAVRVSLQQTIKKIYKLYEKRGVSFMFTENLKKHIPDDAKHLEQLYLLLPDLIKQNNQITQINRFLDVQAICRRLDLISQ